MGGILCAGSAPQNLTDVIGRIQQRKKSMRAYIAYFRLMAHRRVYETSLGETVNFSGARLNAAYFMRLGETPRRSL